METGGTIVNGVLVGSASEGVQDCPLLTRGLNLPEVGVWESVHPTPWKAAVQLYRLLFLELTTQPPCLSVTVPLLWSHRPGRVSRSRSSCVLS